MSSEEEFVKKLKKAQNQIRERKDPNQIREIVPFEEWIENPYYVGSISDTIFDFWKKNAIKFWEQYTSGESDEVAITGSLGVGKTFYGLVLMLRKLYFLSCFENPQRIWGFADTSDLILVYLSVKKKSAREGGYSELRDLIGDIRYFQENFWYDESVVSEMRFNKNNIYFRPGSSSSDTIGQNVICAMLDESNFWKKGGGDPGNVEVVREIYSDARHRRQNRFNCEFDEWEHMNGFSLLVSSASHAKSFLEQRKKEADVTEIRGVKYKVKSEQFSDEKFTVYIGNDDTEPEVVEGTDRLKEIIHSIDDWIELEGDTCEEIVNNCPEYIQEMFVHPPMDFYEEFKSDIYNSLQDISGVAVGATGSFFGSEQVWVECETNAIPFAFTDEEVTLSTNDPTPLKEYFNPSSICAKKKVQSGREEKEVWVPRFNKNAYRYIHLDMSASNDSTGIAMCHITGWNQEPGSGIDIPSLAYDLMLRITPPDRSGRIDHEKIINFVAQLKNVYNFPVKGVSMDKYASESNLQLLNKYLFKHKEDEEAVYLSTSKEEVYLDFLGLLYKKHVQFCEYSVFKREFFHLEHYREDNKVDHPKKFPDGTPGHNDVSDAVVGASALAKKVGEGSSSPFVTNNIIEGDKSEKVENSKDAQKQLGMGDTYEGKKDAVNRSDEETILNAI